MKSYKLITIYIIFLVLTAFALWQYVFTIYEVKSEISRYSITAGSNELIEISVFPINAMGNKAPFKKVNAVFSVEEGASLIEIDQDNFENGKIKFRVKEVSGIVKIKIFTEFSLFPIIQEFEVLREK
jgi:hypothetical protein